MPCKHGRKGGEGPDQTSQATCGFASFSLVDIFFNRSILRNYHPPLLPSTLHTRWQNPGFYPVIACKGQRRYPVITGSAMFSSSAIDWIKLECVGTGSGLLHTITASGEVLVPCSSSRIFEDYYCPSASRRQSSKVIHHVSREAGKETKKGRERMEREWGKRGRDRRDDEGGGKKDLSSPSLRDLSRIHPPLRAQFISFVCCNFSVLSSPRRCLP